MNSPTPSIGQLVRRHLLSSTAGKIAVMAALFHVPMVAFLGAKAYAEFPGGASETMAWLALMHLGAIAALFSCWLYYGMLLRFKNNMLQNLLLILLTLAPFFPTYAVLSTA